MNTELLKKKRKEKGLSQRKTAKLSKITQQHYNAIESGKSGCSTKVAKRIADVLDFYWGNLYDK